MAAGARFGYLGGRRVRATGEEFEADEGLVVGTVVATQLVPGGDGRLEDLVGELVGRMLSENRCCRGTEQSIDWRWPAIGFTPGRHRGWALVDTACVLAACASCLTDVEARTLQGASCTALRVARRARR